MTSPSSARDDGGRPAPILVLVNPQDIVNIASAVRIAKNFGIERMRLVDPEVFDPWRIEGIAHNTADFVARIEILPSLQAALADCVSAYVLTGRERAAKRTTRRPREAAAELVRELEDGPVAIVAGREDSGLTNAELDLCRTVVTIATDPTHPSLNLAQAVAIMAYEIWNARGGEALPLKPPRREAAAAHRMDGGLRHADVEPVVDTARRISGVAAPDSPRRRASARAPRERDTRSRPR